MAISAQGLGDQIAIGGSINQQQLEALSKISVDSNSVLDNLEALNEELQESGYRIESNPEAQQLPTTDVPAATTPPKKKSVSSLKQKLNNSRKANTAQSRPPRREVVKEPTMDFDQELEAAAQQLDEAAPENMSVEDGMREQIMELLKNTPGAPSAVQIAKWKAQYGDKGVHVMAFGEGDVYIFTHLKRGQWKKIQELMQKAQAQGQIDVEDMLKEKTVTYCTLWPTPLPIEFFYNSKAGVVDSLYQVILLNSYFLSPQQAMMLTTQL